MDSRPHGSGITFAPVVVRALIAVAFAGAPATARLPGPARTGFRFVPYSGAPNRRDHARWRVFGDPSGLEDLLASSYTIIAMYAAHP